MSEVDSNGEQDSIGSTAAYIPQSARLSLKHRSRSQQSETTPENLAHDCRTGRRLNMARQTRCTKVINNAPSTEVRGSGQHILEKFTNTPRRW